MSSVAPLTPADRAAIAELFAHYGRAFDTADIDGFIATFAPDALYDLPGGRRYRGRAEIRTYISAQASKPGYPGRQHHVAQLIFEGDGSQCSVRSYAFGTHLAQDGSHSLAFLGYYRDVCVKLDGRWLFAERVFRNWEGEVLDRFT